MYIGLISTPARNTGILLRESKREIGRMKKHSLSKLNDWPDDLASHIRFPLKGGCIRCCLEKLEIKPSELQRRVMNFRVYVCK